MNRCSERRFEHTPTTNGLLHSEAWGSFNIVAEQLGLPRALRNVDQACQVEPIDGDLVSFSLDVHTFISNQASSGRERTHLDVLFDFFTNLPRQLVAQDGPPFRTVLMSIDLCEGQQEKYLIWLRCFTLDIYGPWLVN